MTKLKRITEDEIKNVIYSGWCSPETKFSDIFLEPWETAIADAQLASCEKECEAEVQKAREEERKKIGECLDKYTGKHIPDWEGMIEALKKGEEVKG